ncbi:MAG: alcohol dehydrogenase, partial [Chthoniobacter sp. 12-60-6]
DAVLELSGSTAAIDSAWPLVRIGGTIVLVGSVFPGPPVSVLPEQVVRRQWTIRGIHNYQPRHLAVAIDFLTAQQQHYPFAELVSRWLPLSSIAEALELSRQPEMIRIGIMPGEALPLT